MKHFCWDDSGFGSLLYGSRFISLGIGICFQEKDKDFGGSSHQTHLTKVDNKPRRDV